MRESIVNQLGYDVDTETDDDTMREVLSAIWTVTKWVTLGVLLVAGGILWWIIGIAFVALSQPRGNL